MPHSMSKLDVVLRFAAAHRNAPNRDFYYDETIRSRWRGDVEDPADSKKITKRIGYAIGSLRKAGFLKTVSRGPPAYYDITPAGLAYLATVGLLPSPTDVVFQHKIDAELKKSPPKDLPFIVGRIEEVGLDYIGCIVKGCAVGLEASRGIIGYILANDLLRKRCKLWLITNEVKWIEKYEYTER